MYTVAQIVVDTCKYNHDHVKTNKTIEFFL